MKKMIVLCLMTSMLGSAAAQVVIGSTATLKTGPNTQIVIQSPGNLTNNSAYDFSEALLGVELKGGVNQTISGNWSISSLRLNSASNKNVSGNLTVTGTLDFVQGYLVPQSSGKILFTGPGDNLTYPPSGDSYVNGIFYQQGTGVRRFPVGTGGASGFALLTLTDVQTNNEIGVQAFNANPSLTFAGSPEVNSVNISRYWQISTANLTEVGSRVELGINDLIIPADQAPTVVQAAATGGEVTNLNSFSTEIGISVTSDLVVTAPIVTTGTTREVNVKIRDLITPGTDEHNAVLMIELLHLYKFNIVTLLDRWGTVIKRWQPYDHTNPQYDFSKLSPGNYICIVEYGNNTEGKNTKKLSQMVTVLKTN